MNETPTGADRPAIAPVLSDGKRTGGRAAHADRLPGARRRQARPARRRLARRLPLRHAVDQGGAPRGLPRGRRVAPSCASTIPGTANRAGGSKTERSAAGAQDSLAVIRALTSGPPILVGSSMGGWIALLVARELARLGEENRLAGLVLIAPAVDFTRGADVGRDSRRPRGATSRRRASWMRPSAYSPEPYPITRGLIEDGRNHLLMGGRSAPRLPRAHPAGHAGPRRALPARAGARRASRARTRVADPDQGWRSSPVARRRTSRG